MPDRRRLALTIAASALLVASLTGCTPSSSSPSISNASNPTPSPAPTASARSTAAQLTSGVEGRVIAGPTCPVERAGQSPCIRPLEGAAVVAVDAAGHEAGRAIADPAGSYRIPLPPGTYTIRPQPVTGVMGTGPEQTVNVVSGAFVYLDIAYDTGIR